MSVHLLYKIDIGFDEGRGYAAVIQDVQLSLEKQANVIKGIKGNSMEQLARRIRRVLIDEVAKRRQFPLESESSRIITNGS
jgi:hypothetical protein